MPSLQALDAFREYRNRFRALIEANRPARDWLEPGERALLNEAAAYLRLTPWERDDCEKQVQEQTFTLRERPTQFWSLTLPGRKNPLASRLERMPLIAALAEHLDIQDPERLRLWCHGVSKEWTRLAQEPGLLNEVVAKRVVRYEQIVLEWARAGQRADGVAGLHQASRHVQNRDRQEAIEHVERKLGHPVVIPGHGDHPPGPTRTAVPIATLDGDYVAKSDASTLITVTQTEFRLKTTRPTLKAGQARIFTRRESGDTFSLTLTDPVGHPDFATLKGIDGTFECAGLTVTQLRGRVPENLEKVFRTAYKRV